MFGQPYNGHGPSICSPFLAQWHNFVSVEVQHAIVARTSILERPSITPALSLWT